MSVYEIEIKSLLGAKEKADELRTKLRKIDPNTKLLTRHSQLNHYFINGDRRKLFNLIAPKLTSLEQEKLRNILEGGTDFSVRTRLTEDKLLFVVKASLNSDSSHNSVSRLEFEVEILLLTQDKLDQLLHDAGFIYQAKWSREREEYACQDVTVCLDKNAGYAYIAEFEKVVQDAKGVEQARRELQAFMKTVGFEELSQERLERMFAYYNTNWQEYYGTEKIFTIH